MAAPGAFKRPGRTAHALHEKADAAVSDRAGGRRHRRSAANRTRDHDRPPNRVVPVVTPQHRPSGTPGASVPFRTNRFGAISARSRLAGSTPQQRRLGYSPRVSSERRANAVYARLDARLSGLLRRRAGLAFSREQQGVARVAARIDARWQNPRGIGPNQLPTIR